MTFNKTVTPSIIVKTKRTHEFILFKAKKNSFLYSPTLIIGKV